MEYKFTMDFNVGSGGAKANISKLVEWFGLPQTIIEIGCFEGGTTFWLADLIGEIHKEKNTDFKIYAIDPHDVSLDLKENISEVYENFKHNLSLCKYNSSIEYIRKKSNEGLIDLISKGVKAQIVYVDGDHTAGAVLTDLILSSELLVPGGVLLCDDSVYWRHNYQLGEDSPAEMSPRMAVESFLFCNWKKFVPLMLPDASQTGLIKKC